MPAATEQNASKPDPRSPPIQSSCSSAVAISATGSQTLARSRARIQVKSVYVVGLVSFRGSHPRHSANNVLTASPRVPSALRAPQKGTHAPGSPSLAGARVPRAAPSSCPPWPRRAAPAVPALPALARLPRPLRPLRPPNLYFAAPLTVETIPCLLDLSPAHRDTAIAVALGPANVVEDDAVEETKAVPTFRSLGVCEQLAEACHALGWKMPTAIQVDAVPVALKGHDIIGLAQMGSGKTGTFALPILQALLENSQPPFACVLSPTRELQTAEQFEALGSGIGLSCAVLVGGIDMMAQSVALAKRPHVVVGTPGRLVDHLTSTKGFSLRTIKYLVLDEADRLLNMDFELEIDEILKVVPKDRCTYLFSATMTTKVANGEAAKSLSMELLQLQYIKCR